MTQASSSSGPRLRRGDLLPRMVVAPPGPRARRLSRKLRASEAPGINTLPPDGGPGFLWQEALGSNVLDVDGNRFVDLTGGFGVAAVGHRHPAVVATIRRQAGRLLHGLGDVHAHPWRAELAAELKRLAPMDDALVYWAISGADAVEIALKTAVLATGRPGILAFDPAYHGLTLGALQVTSRSELREPFAGHFHNRVRRLDFGCAPGRIADALRADPEIGCVIVEPIVGREGVLTPPAGWLGELASICHGRGVPWIADEVLTGLGRTGRWFAVDEEGLAPDLLCCGKSLGGGLPIAATIGRRELMERWRRPGEAMHTATFTANPLSCAAGLEVLAILRRERLVRRTASLGLRIARRTASWPDRFTGVVEVRGRGLLQGVELGSSDLASTVTHRLLDAGFLALAGGPEGRVLEITPPLTIRRAQLEAFYDELEGILADLPRR